MARQAVDTELMVDPAEAAMETAALKRAAPQHKQAPLEQRDTDMLAVRALITHLRLAQALEEAVVEPEESAVTEKLEERPLEAQDQVERSRSKQALTLPTRLVVTVDTETTSMTSPVCMGQETQVTAEAAQLEAETTREM